MENLLTIDDGFDYKEEEKEETREKFVVDSLSACDWCFRKLGQIKKIREEQTAYVKNIIDEYKEYLEKEIKKLDDYEAYFKGLLEAYVNERMKEDPKFKLKTAVGSASYGKLQTKFEWVDENKVLEFLEDNELYDFIEVKKSIKKTDFKKQLTGSNGLAVDENGEIVEGIVSSEFRNFNVKY